MGVFLRGRVDNGVCTVYNFGSNNRICGLDNSIMGITQKIYEETLARGGSTTDLLGNVPVTGFMVSELGGVEVPLNKFSVQDVECVAIEHWNALFGIGAYIGTWIDRETDTVHIDYSVNFTELGNALSFGRKNGQKAIYSLNTKEVIYL